MDDLNIIVPRQVISKDKSAFLLTLGAENETRTRDPNLGKVMLYQLSYFRSFKRVVFVWDCKGRQNFFTSKLFCINFQKKWLIFIFQPLFMSFRAMFRTP